MSIGQIRVSCDGLAGALFCGSGTVNWGGLLCPEPRCGDGTVTELCFLKPEAIEVCDPNAPNQGCAEDHFCTDGCQTCKPCECDDQAAESDCPGSKVCSGCQCRDAPPCSATIFEMLLGLDDWWEPLLGGDWCPSGQCDPDACRCVPAQWTFSVSLKNNDSGYEAVHIFPTGDSFGSSNKVLAGAALTAAVSGSPGDAVGFTAGRSGTVTAKVSCSIGDAKPTAAQVTYTPGKLTCSGWKAALRPSAHNELPNPIRFFD